MTYTDRPTAGQQDHSAPHSTTPPTGCINPCQIAPAVAADPRWYGFRWNGKGTPPAYFYFPDADEVTFDSGEPAAIIPGPGKGSSFDVTHAALLDGAKLDGIAMLAPGTKRPELFNVRDDWLLWTKESTATEQERITLLDALGYYTEESRALLIEQGMLPKPPAGNGQDHHVTEPPQAVTRDEPVIDAIPGELHLVVRKAEQALLTAGVDIFQRIGVLVRPATLPTEVQVPGATIAAGSLIIEPVSKAWLAERMNEVATWRKYNERKKEMVATDCPMKYAEHYLAKKGEWNVRVLTGIIEAPTLRRDGSLLTTPGYDPLSGLFLNYTGEPVSVPDHPTKDDALKALEVLKEPFEEFPFVSEVDRSVALSGVLTPVCRRQLGTAPFHAFDAPTPGSGKGLLADICAMVATGRVATVSTLGADEAETEKRLGALLMRGVPVISLDNAARPIEGDFICSLATQKIVDPRILGKSDTATIPTNTATIFVTGNNLIFKGDMTRRVLLCRIDPQCERPDALQFKRNLHEFVPANRHRLLSAALTVLRAFVCAGRPAHGKAPYGSFPEWDALVRGALLWLGQPDPLESRERIVDNDPATTGFHSLLKTWFEVFSDRAVTTHEVSAAAKPDFSTGEFATKEGEELHHALIEVAGNLDGLTVNTTKLGKYLGKHRDKVSGEHRLEQAGVYGSRPLWKVCTFAGFAGSTTQSAKFRSDEKEAKGSAKNLQAAEETCITCITCTTCTELPAADEDWLDFDEASRPTEPLGRDARRLYQWLLDTKFNGWEPAQELALNIGMSLDQVRSAATELNSHKLARFENDVVRVATEGRA